MFTPSPTSLPARTRCRIGITAALLLCAGLIGCTSTDVPQVSASDGPVGALSIPSNVELDPGTYLVGAFTVPFEVTVPDGWTYSSDKGLLEGRDVFLKFDTAGFVPVDACAWSTPLTQVGPTVDEFADALAAAESTTTSAPIDVEIDGYAGVEFDLAIDADVVMDECRDSHVCIHSVTATYCSRYFHEGLGQRETFRVIDLSGYRALMTVGQWAEDADPAMVQEARTVFDSITFVSD